MVQFYPDSTIRFSINFADSKMDIKKYSVSLSTFLFVKFEMLIESYQYLIIRSLFFNTLLQDISRNLWCATTQSLQTTI